MAKIDLGFIVVGTALLTAAGLLVLAARQAPPDVPPDMPPVKPPVPLPRNLFAKDLQVRYEVSAMLSDKVRDDLRALGIMDMSALNEDDLPFKNASGRFLYITEINFEYRGPKRNVAIGFALRPTGKGILGALLGLPFNHGQNAVVGAFTFATFTLAASAGWAPVTLDTKAGFQVPAPGDYKNRIGETVRFNDGEVGTWAWLVDLDLIKASGREGGEFNAGNLMYEPFILKEENGSALFINDVGVVSLAAPMAAKNLAVRYSLV
ncbi:MAG: hypothetical protein Q8R28_12415 [Dehalococcoidia bacterium]|nr:hypothetical protein [Dehalococcoidia bacterium]